MKDKGIFTNLSNNKGISLIEVIVSVAIMAMVTGPFLGTIILSTRNNTYSQQVLKASELAQNVMEEIKSRPDFLEENAVFEADAQITDYSEYLQEEGYSVKYKIIKQEKVVSSLSETYEFKDISDISEGDLNFYVDSGSLSLNGISYSLEYNAVPLDYYLEISGASGLYEYTFYDENSALLQSNMLSPVEVAENIRINIEYLNDCEDIFKLNVNVDDISDGGNVVFYVIDDKMDAFKISNTGVDSFYQFNEASSDYKSYYNILFEIELIVDYKGEEYNRLVSYVKKNR